MLRVHSQDLHEHVASEAGECLDSGLYTDLAIRCGTEFNPVLLVSWNFTTKISKTICSPGARAATYYEPTGLCLLQSRLTCGSCSPSRRRPTRSSPWTFPMRLR